MKTGVYDFSEVFLIVSHKVAGTFVVTGYMAETGIKITRKNDTWDVSGSSDGTHATLVRNPNKSSDIEISLSQSSVSLDYLNGIADYAERVKNKSIVFSVSVVDKSSRSVYHSDFTVLGKPTSVEFGTQETGRDFKFSCSGMSEVLGGSADLTRDEAATIKALGINVDESWIKQ